MVRFAQGVAGWLRKGEVVADWGRNWDERDIHPWKTLIRGEIRWVGQELGAISHRTKGSECLTQKRPPTVYNLRPSLVGVFRCGQGGRVSRARSQIKETWMRRKINYLQADRARQSSSRPPLNQKRNERQV